MKEKEVEIVNIKDEREEELSTELYDIRSWGADLSFRELISRYEGDELVKPEMQRHYVWDKTEASRFIDSLLLGLPVPSIFLSRTDEEKLLIIDGYQRIMTVYDYFKGIWREDGKVFKLSNSKKINSKWRGKAFSELEESLQRKITNTTIHAILFEQNKPTNNSNSMFLIFERINTSGRTLNAQEIRNCIYQGKLNRSIIEFNGETNWRKLFGTEAADSRMQDVEQLTRIISFVVNNIESEDKESIQLKKYLNEFMERDLHKVIPEDVVEKLTKVFKWINTSLTQNAFRTYNLKKGKYNNKFHPPLFDAIVLACIKEIDQKGSLGNRANAEKNKLELLQNSEFTDAITVRTTRIENIKKRIRMAREALFK
ncbi:MAG: DUF262 domain-containing protein [Candidatus Saganbacteria bacterium]|nr:DUF262 domain-containing protein [Candidatus Saganbacteria bacterium]